MEWRWWNAALPSGQAERLALGFGASPLGSLGSRDREISSLDLIWTAYERGFRAFDVAPFYGHGLAELRLGAALRHLPREQLHVSTKVGRLLNPVAGLADPDRIPFRPRFDYGAEATRRSLSDSLSRLSLARIDLALVHDLSSRWHGDDLKAQIAAALDGAFPVLVDLRDQGVVAAIGIGTNDPMAAERIVEAADIDVVMLAGAPTLLKHQGAERLLALCSRRKISVIAAAPFNSGILATGSRPGARYFYQPASAQILERVRRLEAICRDHQIPLGAAALQAPLRHAAVELVLPGFSGIAEMDQCLAWFRHPIADAFWHDLASAQGRAS